MFLYAYERICEATKSHTLVPKDLDWPAVFVMPIFTDAPHDTMIYASVEAMYVANGTIAPGSAHVKISRIIADLERCLRKMGDYGYAGRIAGMFKSVRHLFQLDPG